MRFKKGDKVKVYGNLGTGCGSRTMPERSSDYYSSGGQLGIVLDSYCENEINVRLTKSQVWPAGTLITAHPKQCRLVKKREAK